MKGQQQGGYYRQITVGFDGEAVGFETGPPWHVAPKNTISLYNQFFHQIFQQEYRFTNFRWFHLMGPGLPGNRKQGRVITYELPYLELPPQNYSELHPY